MNIRKSLFPWLLAALSPAPLAAQDSVEQFYRGRTINLVIGSNVGGGYDYYGRLVGRHLGKYIPGKPNVVPANMAGAGGNTAAAYVYSVAPRDGTAIVASSSGSLLDALIGDKSAVRHDPLKFNFIGSANSEVSLCLARKDAAAQSFRDVFTKEILIGSSGGTTRDLPTALNNVLGTKLRLIAGYPGTREVMLAVDKGEVQGLCGIGYTSTISQKPEWFTPDSPVRVLAQEAIRGLPELDRAGVPLAIDFARTPEDRKILEIIYSQLVFTRPFMMAPDVPPERVEAIRRAFLQALADPDLIAEGAKLNLVIDAMPGKDLEAMIRGLYAQPPELVQKVRKALAAP
jgi:tripartite-type tricarboxylate transporter receptor subunit TctC